MKEFTHSLKQNFMVNKRNIVKYLCIAAICGVLGILVTLLILFMDGNSKDYVQIGALMAVCGGGILLLVGAIESVPLDFNLAVSTGRVRKSFAPTRYISWLVNVAAVLGMTLLVGAVEDLLYPILYPGIICVLNVNAFIGSPVIFLGLLLSIPAVIMLFGALVLRLGSNFLWIIWGGTMLFSMLCQHISRAVHESPETLLGRMGRSITEAFTNGPSVAGLLVFLILGAICMGVTVVILRKQRVNF